MKKKIVLSLAVCLFFSAASFAQLSPASELTKNLPQKPLGNAETTPNYQAALMYYYEMRSEKILVPDSVISLIKNYARKNNVTEALALKISTQLKPLYNDFFTPREKIEVINHLRMMPWEQIVPLSFFDAEVKRIQKLY